MTQIELKKLEKRYKKTKVLEKINIKIEKGEKVGIVGNNGAGKTTLLKIIAEIIPESNGSIKTEKDSIYISSFHNGLHPKLSIKDNVYLLATFFGLKNKETNILYPKIIKFAELDEYQKVKLENASRGMITRCGFSTIINIIKYKHPKLIILDEALSGGDTSFQKKCLKEIKELSQNNITLIIATHNIQRLKELTTKTIWIEKGKIREIGKTDKIVDSYNNESLLS